jgi:hypothetical protein
MINFIERKINESENRKRFYQDEIKDTLEEIKKTIKLSDHKLDIYLTALSHLGNAVKALDKRVKALERSQSTRI